TAAALTLAVAAVASALASERKVSAVQRLVSGLTLTLLLATPSRAGWVSHGPEGGTVTALAVDSASPSTVYAGTFGGGVFKTTDGGGSWSAVNTGLPSNADVAGARAVDTATGPTTADTGADGGGGGKKGGGGGARCSRGTVAAGCSRRRPAAGAVRRSPPACPTIPWCPHSRSMRRRAGARSTWGRTAGCSRRRTGAGAGAR